MPNSVFCITTLYLGTSAVAGIRDLSSVIEAFGVYWKAGYHPVLRE